MNTKLEYAAFKSTKITMIYANLGCLKTSIEIDVLFAKFEYV